MGDPYDLGRFVAAQDAGGGAYHTSQDLSVKFLRAITCRPGRSGARAPSCTSAQ
jgi:hypothetical protein